jgi:phytanoyl-CoA hydroxylase
MNQLIAQFAAEGCLYVPGFFSEAQCRTLKTAYQESIKLSSEPFLRQTTTKYETHNFSEDGFITNPLLNVHLLADTYQPFSERVLQLLASDKLRDLLSQVFKAAPVLVQTMYFESSRGTSLHVDSDFIDSTQEGSMIGCWIPLEDIDEEAGRFCYYPKSFLLKEEGHFDSESTGLFKSYRELCIRSVQNFQSDSKSTLLDNAMKSKKLMAALLKKSNLEIRVDEVKTGDLILFNSLTIHGSMKPKMTGKSRNSLTAHFIPGNTNLLKFQQHIISLNILQQNELLYHV